MNCVENCLNAIALRYPSSQTILVVSPKIFADLIVEMEHFISYQQIKVAQKEWMAVKLVSCFVCCDSSLAENSLAVFTKEKSESVCEFLSKEYQTAYKGTFPK